MVLTCAYSYFHHQSIALSIMLCWNLVHCKFADYWMQCRSPCRSDAACCYHYCCYFLLLFCSLLSFKVLIGIVLLGKAHQSIDENRRTVRAKDLASSHQGDMKPVSKDDLDLLPVIRSSPSAADASALRRTQSLSQFVPAADDHVMVSELLYSFLLEFRFV